MCWRPRRTGSPRRARAPPRSTPPAGSSPPRWRRSAGRHREAAAAMIRVVIYLIAIGVLALGAAWLAERPGDVAITWQGWRLDTSVTVMVLAVAAVAALTVALWSVLRAIWRSPRVLRQHRRARRNARGYLALSQGLIAVGS